LHFGAWADISGAALQSRGNNAGAAHEQAVPSNAVLRNLRRGVREEFMPVSSRFDMQANKHVGPQANAFAVFEDAVAARTGRSIENPTRESSARFFHSLPGKGWSWARIGKRMQEKGRKQ
jgi:hypothetical protein